eukprot:558164-Prymnesium_polylepis.1
MSSTALMEASAVNAANSAPFLVEKTFAALLTPPAANMVPSEERHTEMTASPMSCTILTAYLGGGRSRSRSCAIGRTAFETSRSANQEAALLPTLRRFQKSLEPPAHGAQDVLRQSSPVVTLLLRRAGRAPVMDPRRRPAPFCGCFWPGHD